MFVGSKTENSSSLVDFQQPGNRMQRYGASSTRVWKGWGGSEEYLKKTDSRQVAECQSLFMRKLGPRIWSFILHVWVDLLRRGVRESIRAAAGHTIPTWESGVRIETLLSCNFLLQTLLLWKWDFWGSRHQLWHFVVTLKRSKIWYVQKSTNEIFYLYFNYHGLNMDLCMSNNFQPFASYWFVLRLYSSFTASTNVCREGEYIMWTR